MAKNYNIFQELAEKGKNMRWLKNQALKRFSPETYIEHQLKEFEKFTQAQISYNKTVGTFLADEREKLFPQIQNALTQNLQSNLKLQSLSRIVRNQFSDDPLNSIGSIKRPPGGRFNFGQTTTFHSKYFQALYIAEDYDTAFQESFHSIEESIGDFSHFTVEVFLEEFLDLRNEKVVTDFFNAIKPIKIPKDFDYLARKLKVDPIEILPNPELLYKLLFTPYYKSWDVWLDQYSHSQWFGFYCYRAGIPGMIYPSVRNDGKFNIVIFYENFKNSNSYVCLQNPQGWKLIKDDRKAVNSNSFQLF